MCSWKINLTCNIFRHHGAIFFVSKPNSNIIEEMDLIFDFWCFNATFSNISAMSWRPVLVVEEAGENHRQNIQ
jgi:hypothetical protein